MIRAHLLLAVILSCAPGVRGAEPLRKHAEPNRFVEFEFVTALKRADPFNEVVLDVVFTRPDGVQLRVPAFWAGGRSWKVRYSSAVAGDHTFRTASSDERDVGLHGISGVVNVSQEKLAVFHPLYTRGALRVSKDKRYLEHADGTPFFWLGDTWWMGLTKRLSFPDEFNTLLADRQKKGFTVVQIVAGLYPDMPAFDERGFNETGHPWEKDYAAIRPQYFDEADKRIMRLVEEGITPCVVGAWGYHLPWLGLEKMKQHQRYVYARWGALPIVWCVAGELNLPFYLNPGFPGGGEKQTAGWEDVIRYCRSINAFKRMITAHPTGIPPMSARGVLKDAETLLDFDMLQTPHGQLDALPPTVNTVRFSYNAKPIMPSVNGEPSYEMLLDKTPAEIARLIFWVCWANGVKGYTYGANGIWQLNGKDKPYGNSPWGGNYGKISWQEAMHLGGSTQVALGKKLLEQYEWQKLEPMPADAVSWTEPTWKDVKIGDWIWYPEGDPAVDAPVASRFFRRTFELPADAKVKRAILHVTADDKCLTFLNGDRLGLHGNWKTLGQFGHVADKLRPGKNVIAVHAENLKADVPKNPASLACGMAIELENGTLIEAGSDKAWRASRDETPKWEQVDFDDAAWSPVQVVAVQGGGPWGTPKPAGDDPYLIPYAMGIAGKNRLIYVPAARAISVNRLEPNARYRASHFDPESGARRDLGEAAPDAAGSWRCELPPQTTHDWVLVLEASPAH